MKRKPESGFALLMVFLMGAIIGITLYMEMPRVAFESQRAREQLLINRGLQYKRAIQLFYRKYRTYPQTMDDLETTRNIRFLRRRYTDPLTGKAEWRIIHVGPGGVLTDSLIKPATPAGTGTNATANGAQTPGSSQTGATTAGTPSTAGTASTTGTSTSGTAADGTQQPPGLNMANRRPSDRILTGVEQPVSPDDPNQQSVPPQYPAQQYPGQPPQYPGQPPQYPGQPPQYPGQPVQPQYPGQPVQPGQPVDPSQPVQPQYPGQPVQPGQPVDPSQQPNPAVPQYPGQPAYPGQPQYPGQPAYPGQPQYPGQPAYPGQPQYPGQPVTPGQPYTYPQVIPGQVPPGQPLPGQVPQTGQPAQPYNPFQQQNQPLQQNQPYNPTQPIGGGVAPTGNTPGQQNPAAGLIQQILTTPRQAPTTGALTGGGTGIAGVASNAEGKGIHVVNDHTKYKEWEFVYDLKNDKSVLGAGAGAMQQQLNAISNGGLSPTQSPNPTQTPAQTTAPTSTPTPAPAPAAPPNQ